MCVILVLDLDDGTGHTLFTARRHASALAVRLSVRCSTVGRFLENRVVHRFESRVASWKTSLD